MSKDVLPADAQPQGLAPEAEFGCSATAHAASPVDSSQAVSCMTCSAPQSLTALLSQRPNLAAWLSEYDSIQAEYAEALRARGIDLDEKGRAQAESMVLRERLREKGASFRNGGASIVTGALSSACVACTGGQGSKTFTLSTACNRHCYFCFNSNQRKCTKSPN